MGFATGGGFSGGGGGEINDGTSLGAGEEVFVDKVGTDLRFKSLVAGTDINLVSDADTITINSNSSGSSRVALKQDVTATVNDATSTIVTFPIVTKTVENSFFRIKYIPQEKSHADTFIYGRQLNAFNPSVEFDILNNFNQVQVREFYDFPSFYQNNDLFHFQHFEYAIYDNEPDGDYTLKIRINSTDVQTVFEATVIIEEVFL